MPARQRQDGNSFLTFALILREPRRSDVQGELTHVPTVSAPNIFRRFAAARTSTEKDLKMLTSLTQTKWTCPVSLCTAGKFGLAASRVRTNRECTEVMGVLRGDALLCSLGHERSCS